MKISTDDPRPPSVQLAQILRDQIADGTYPPGSKLPSRAALASEYGVATATANLAVTTLSHEGLVIGQQGRGVFVRSPRTDSPEERSITITLAGVSDEQYNDFILSVWATAQASIARGAGGTFTVAHDGEADLSHKLDTLWGSYGRDQRWATRN